MEEEIWVAVPDYEGHYEISNLGRVRGLKWNIIRKTVKMNNTRCVILSKLKVSNTYGLARLVWTAFNGKPDGFIAYKDGNPDNCALDNLRVDPGYFYDQEIIEKAKRLSKEGKTIREIAEALNIPAGTVHSLTGRP